MCGKELQSRKPVFESEKNKDQGVVKFSTLPAHILTVFNVSILDIGEHRRPPYSKKRKA
jgi:hypothetical protein